MPDELLTLDEFCQRIRISKKSLYNLWKRGEGPRTVRIGARVLIDPADAHEWLEAQKYEHVRVPAEA